MQSVRITSLIRYVGPLEWFIGLAVGALLVALSPILARIRFPRASGAEHHWWGYYWGPTGQRRSRAERRRRK